MVIAIMAQGRWKVCVCVCALQQQMEKEEKEAEKERGMGRKRLKEKCEEELNELNGGDRGRERGEGRRGEGDEWRKASVGWRRGSGCH